MPPLQRVLAATDLSAPARRAAERAALLCKETSAALVLLHVANHKTYHRGYVAVVLYQLGGRPPVMDLPVFLRDAPRVLCGAQQEAARSDRTA